MMPAVSWSPGSGKAVKRGSSTERDVHPEGRGFARDMGHAARGLGRDRALGEQFGEQPLRVDAGDHRLGAPGLAAGDETGRPSLLDDHFLDRQVEHDLDPGLARCLGHRLGDRAHPADRMAPGARHPRRLAEDMVEQDIGRARRIGARIMADDRVEAEQGLDQVVREIALEDVGGGFGEEIDKVALVLEAEPVHPGAELQQGEEVRQPAARIGRRVAAATGAAVPTTLSSAAA